jgi:hypothetical protein
VSDVGEPSGVFTVTRISTHEQRGAGELPELAQLESAIASSAIAAARPMSANR